MKLLSNIISLIPRSERRGIFTMIIFIVIGMIFETLSVGLLLPALSIMFDQESSFRLLFPDEFLGVNLLYWIAASVLSLYVVKIFYLVFLAWKTNNFVFGIQEKLARSILIDYLKRPYSFFISTNSSELLNNVTTEVTIFTFNIMQPIMILISEIFILVALTILLIIVQPQGTIVVVLLFLLVALVFYFLSSKYIKLWGEERQVNEYKRLKELQQVLTVIKETKLYALERYFLQRFDMYNTVASKAGRNHQTVLQLPRLLIEFMAILGVLVFSLTIYLTVKDNGNSIIPTIGIFLASAFRLMPSFNRIISSIQQIKFATPVVEILYKFRNEENLDFVHDASRLGLEFFDNIFIENLSYCYMDNLHLSLKNLTLTVQNGQMIGIIGESGSGKSTFVDVLMGILTPTSGLLYSGNGRNISDREEWSKLFSYVPQSISLIDDTLKRNIALGVSDSEINYELLDEVIHMAHLSEVVNGLEFGLETNVGENGISLSGGQRQRIGLARALYRESPVVILDEATSALDGDTENILMESLLSLKGLRTMVIVAHRLSTLRACDVIYKLEKGELVFSGSFVDLK